MDMGLNEQQEMLRRTAREMLEAECPTTVVREIEASDDGYSPELWRRMADLGWLGIAFPDEYGGSDGTLLDQVVLFEEIGRALAPGPMLCSSVLGGQILLNAASADQKARLLPLVARGDTVLTVALAEARDHLSEGEVSARSSDGGAHILNGSKMFVPYAHASDYLLCEAGSGADGGTLLLVDTHSPGLSATPMESVANYKQHEVRLQDVRVSGANVVGGPGRVSAPISRAVEWATVVQCGEMVGRAEKILELVVDYSQVRVQFGRPIGSFQAIQHHCADLRLSVDGLRLSTYQAAWKLMEGLPGSEDVAMAKALAGSVSRQAYATGHGIFAGIAFATEHDMHLYTQRSKVSEVSLGDTDYHLDRLGTLMGF